MKSSPQGNPINTEPQADDPLTEFIEEYKLHKIKANLIEEGITIDFLVSRTQDEISSIAQELTSKEIQQQKLIFAVTTRKQKMKSSPQENPINAEEIKEQKANNAPLMCREKCGKNADKGKWGYCSVCYLTKPIVTLNRDNHSKVLILEYDNKREYILCKPEERFHVYRDAIDDVLRNTFNVC
eukprot:361882_1